MRQSTGYLTKGANIHTTSTDKTFSTTNSGARSRPISWRPYRIRLPPGFLFLLRRFLRRHRRLTPPRILRCKLRIPSWPSRCDSDRLQEFIRAHVFSSWRPTSWLFPGFLRRVWHCGVSWWASALQGIIKFSVAILSKTSFFLRRIVWVGFIRGGEVRVGFEDGDGAWWWLGHAIVIRVGSPVRVVAVEGPAFLYYFFWNVIKFVIISIAEVRFRKLEVGDEVHTSERQTQQASFSGNWQTGWYLFPVPPSIPQKIRDSQSQADLKQRKGITILRILTNI